MAKVTQKDRIERALRRTGQRGITQADFIGAVIVDGGAPITRVAARIDELKQSGLKITAFGHRDGGCVIYRLEEHIPPPPAAAPKALAPPAAAAAPLQLSLEPSDLAA